MIRSLLFFFFLTFASTTKSSILDEIDDELNARILESVHPNDLQSVRQTSGNLRDLLDGKFFRSKIFNVTDPVGKKISLKNYLESQRAPVSDIRNIDTLMEEKPDLFMQFVLNSIPHTFETIKSDLQNYCHNIIKIDNLVESVAAIYETPQDRLAGIILELMTWKHIQDQVEAQVGAQIWLQLEEHDQYLSQVGPQVSSITGDILRAQIQTNIKRWLTNQFWNQVEDTTWNLVRDQVRDQVWVQLNNDLQYFEFLHAYTEGKISEVEKAIEYTFTVYQIATISMKHYDEFKSLLYHVSNSISHRFNEKQILDILNGMTISEAPEGNYLVDIQIKFIKRLIRSKS